MTGLGEPVSVIDRSAESVTMTSTVAVSLLALGSRDSDCTVTDAVIVPVTAGAVVTIVMAGAAPVGSGAACVQVTSWPRSEHDQPVPIPDTYALFIGSVRLIAAPTASVGPL